MKNFYHKIVSDYEYQVPDNWHKMQCIDMHTGGEPLRVVVAGFPEIKGNGILEKRKYVKKNLDNLRKALMWEPRGHADMYGCLLTEPDDDQAHFGVIFMHNEGYSTMCGHAVIALGRLAVEMRWIDRMGTETEVVMDAPCGRIYAFVNAENGVYKSTRFRCVPSFVVSLDENIEVEGIGVLKHDLAFGGAFYAYVDADKIGLSLEKDNYSNIIKAGRDIKKAILADTPDPVGLRSTSPSAKTQTFLLSVLREEVLLIKMVPYKNERSGSNGCSTFLALAMMVFFMSRPALMIFE